MNQERKNKRAPLIKKILKKYGLKGSISVRNYSTLIVTVSKGSLDFMKCFEVTRDYGSLNVYHGAERAKKNGYETIANFIDEMTEAMYGDDYYDNTDAMIDYFDTSHYIDIQIGKYNKPYLLEASKN